MKQSGERLDMLISSIQILLITTGVSMILSFTLTPLEDEKKESKIENIIRL